MIQSVIIDLAADADIAEYFIFIGEDNFDAAIRFIDSVRDTFGQLREMPGLGRRVEVANQDLDGMRVWPIKSFPNYLIYYIASETKLRVVRVLHGARDLDSIFSE